MKVTGRFLKSVARLSESPRDKLPEIAFLGRSNVGKSSLINSLLGVRLARTSSTPGRTQLINFYLVNQKFYFVDCPGYGFAKVPEEVRQHWHRLMEEYLESREPLKLNVLLLDSRVAPTPLDEQMLEWLMAYQKPLALVLTKTDKLSGNELRETHKRLQRWTQDSSLIDYSAIKHIGRRELWREILNALPT
ncbi:MAG: ribosome biogenesis GTP-binding protein YihA/YsxC [Acidobacteriia bacterium]|nr:ribosome biogenesis GTP-binding protein YihA/YsxC [Terriglobia bacterium]